jgi:hypothetical protein
MQYPPRVLDGAQVLEYAVLDASSISLGLCISITATSEWDRYLISPFAAIQT